MKHSTQQTSSTLSMALALWLFVVLGCSYSGNLTKNSAPPPTSNITNGNDTDRPDLPKPSPTIVIPVKDTPDYKAGYEKGVQVGREWARANARPFLYPNVLGNISYAQAEDAEPPPKDKRAWRTGFEEGFVEGFREIKPKKY